MPAALRGLARPLLSFWRCLAIGTEVGWAQLSMCDPGVRRPSAVVVQSHLIPHMCMPNGAGGDPGGFVRTSKHHPDRQNRQNRPNCQRCVAMPVSLGPLSTAIGRGKNPPKPSKTTPRLGYPLPALRRILMYFCSATFQKLQPNFCFLREKLKGNN